MIKYEKSCGAVLFRLQDTQLLYLTVEYKIERGYWGLVKGHVEPGESAQDTARREIYEEVGLKTISFIHGFRTEITYSPKPGVEKQVIFFLARAADEPITYHWQEHVDHRWLPYQQMLAQLTYPDDRSVIEQAHQFLHNSGIARDPDLDGDDA